MQRRLFLSLAVLPAAAAPSRTDCLRRMARVMGPLPKLPRHPPAVTVLDEAKDGAVSRIHLRYEAQPCRWVTAWLLRPDGAGRRPAALALHQTTRIGKDEPAGAGPNANLHYAKELAERGWVVLAPDYPSFGEDKTDFERDVYTKGYQSGTMYGIVNHIRGVDLLAARAEVDPKRIGAIGHSLGGHNTLFVAAFDRRIRAAVTSCGFTAFARYYGGNLKGWTSPRYMPRIDTVYGNDPAKVPFDFTDVLGAIAPRAVFINAPTRDSNFDRAGVEETVARVAAHFPKARLAVEYPESGHDFPPEVRRRAYAFLEEQLPG